MDPIYDHLGHVVALLDGDDILNLHGRYIAFIARGSIIAYRWGKHLGWFEDGAFWDSHVRAVGMLSTSTAPLANPGLSGVPGQPGKAGRPGRPGPPGTPGRPGRSNSWASSGGATGNRRPNPRGGPLDLATVLRLGR